METQADFLAALRQAHALIEGHFLLSSGLHSREYVQCAQLLQYPEQAERAGQALASMAPAADVVVSPAMGGLFLGHEVARALKKRHIFCEREGGTMVLRRGFNLQAGERVLVVEDVFTTGKSTREVMEVVRCAGGVVVAALSLVFRGTADLAFGVPTRSLVSLKIDSFDPSACPMCKNGVPVVKPGSRPVGGTRG